MKKIMLAGLLLFLFTNLFAQVTVYRTYQEYANNKGTAYDDFDKWTTGSNLYKVNYIFLKNGEKEKIVNSEMWGFKYKDVLFRIFPNGKELSVAKVISTGNITYYEFGWEHLRLAKSGKPEGKEPDNMLVPAYSIGLNDPVAMGKFRTKKKEEEIEAFRKAHPEHETVYKCLEDKFDLLEIRKCVTDYNAKK